MEPVVAFTIAFGQEARAAARLLRITFKLQHPDIPFLIVDEEVYALFAGQREIAHPGEIMGLRIMVGYFLAHCYRHVIHFDSDILILAPLPRLVQAGEGAVLTHDVARMHYGMPTTPINAGVFAASTPEFWRCWMITNYSFVVPLIGNFFDQFSLRALCMRNLITHTVLPETEEKDYYNISYHDHPGPWRCEGTAVYKGDARVRLWHWAGYMEKCTLNFLPEPIQKALQNLLDGPLPGPEAKELDVREEGRMRAALAERGHVFWNHMARELVCLTTHVLYSVKSRNGQTPEMIFGTDISAAWDALRPPTEGLYRRFLPKAPRYLYSADRERLFSEEAESFNRPWKST